MPIKPSAHVVLLQESSSHIPLGDFVEAGQGLALLRQCDIRSQGHLVRTERQRLQLAQRFIPEEPKIVFLLVGRGQVSAALAFLDAFKNIPRGTSVVIGGIYGTLCSHEFTQRENVHAILLGEWVESLCEYALSILKTGFGVSVCGAMVRGMRGWVLNEQRTYKPELTKWPDPDLEDFRLTDIIHHRGGAVPIHASRGFPFQSLFSDYPLIAGLQKTSFPYYIRPAERVVAEAEKLRKQFRVRLFEFVDEIFPWTGDWTQEFVELWRARVHTPFRIRSASEYLTEDRLMALRQAKLSHVELCAESGDEEVRRRVSNLNQTNERITQAITLLNQASIESTLRLMINVPGDTYRALRDAVKLAKKSNPTYIRPEIFQEPPDSVEWTKTERDLTGANAPRRRASDQAVIARDAVVALQEMHNNASIHRSESYERPEKVALDTMADYPLAKVRSPFEGAITIEHFHTIAEARDVIALRIPARVAWEVRFPDSPIVTFGMLLRPELPGERSRLPVSFSVLAEQNGRTFRIFQKVLIQSLDPDSRRWHWFRIPVTGVRRGEGLIVLESLVYGKDANFIPTEGDIWAGWGRLILAEESLIVETGEHEGVDHGFDGKAFK